MIVRVVVITMDYLEDYSEEMDAAQEIVKFYFS
jgi:hypothetical protein